MEGWCPIETSVECFLRTNILGRNLLWWYMIELMDFMDGWCPIETSVGCFLRTNILGRNLLWWHMIELPFVLLEGEIEILANRLMDTFKSTLPASEGAATTQISTERQDPPALETTSPEEVTLAPSGAMSGASSTIESTVGVVGAATPVSEVVQASDAGSAPVATAPAAPEAPAAVATTEPAAQAAEPQAPAAQG